MNSAEQEGETSSASNVRETLNQDLGSVTQTAKHDLDAITQKAAEDAKLLKDQASEQISAATDKAKSFAGDQKDLAAEQLGGIAAAIGRVADELSSSDQSTIGRYAKDLANGLNKASDTVKNKDVDDLMGIAQDFGRSQPLAFLGAAALAGFVASRFALASAHRRETRTDTTTGNNTGNGTPVQGSYGAATGGDNGF